MKTGKCEICGAAFDKTRNRRYCHDCASKRYAESTRVAMKKYHERLKREAKEKKEKQEEVWHVVKCTGCYYYRSFGCGSPHACHYCLDTGIPRGVHPHECYQQPGTPYKTK